MSTEKALLKNLINNAFDFLETGLRQFQTQPKYSVIHFCSAIELLLKARLMHEHWSLIVSGEPDLRKFKAGDFKSVNFKDLIHKIENVTDEKIPDAAKHSFLAIANHRNKMVHFFHEANNTKASQKEIKTIAIEQCVGWFLLRRLLEKWSTVFEDYQERIQSLNYEMKAHEVYLVTVFDQIKPEIKRDKQKGAIYRKCTYCKREASKENKLTEHVCECKCKVCLGAGYVLKIPCPECEKIIEVEEGWDGEKACECGYQLDQEALSDAVDTDPVTHDNYFDYTHINCAACGGYQTVVHHHELLICTECTSVFNEWGVCGWCNEGQVGGGDLEHSYYSGCELCDGYAGHMRDD